jgi:hypothetical protein
MATYIVGGGMGSECQYCEWRTLNVTAETIKILGAKARMIGTCLPRVRDCADDSQEIDLRG